MSSYSAVSPATHHLSLQYRGTASQCQYLLTTPSAISLTTWLNTTLSNSCGVSGIPLLVQRTKTSLASTEGRKKRKVLSAHKCIADKHCLKILQNSAIPIGNKFLLATGVSVWSIHSLQSAGPLYRYTKAERIEERMFE